MIRSTDACCKSPHTKVYECHDFPKPPFCPIGPTGATGSKGATGSTGSTGSNFLETLVAAVVDNINDWNIQLDPGNNFQTNGEYKVPSTGVYEVEIVINVRFNPVLLTNENPFFALRNVATNQNLIVGWIPVHLGRNRRVLQNSQVNLIRYLSLAKNTVIQPVYRSDGAILNFSLQHSTLSIKRIA